MRARLASILLIAGVIALFAVHQPRAQLIGESVWRTVPSSCAGFSIDGSNTVQTGGGSITEIINLTTTSNNDILVVEPIWNGGNLTATSVVGSLSGVYTKRTAGTLNQIEEWVNTWTSHGTDVVTITWISAPGFFEAIAFGVHGGKISSPFDSNGSIPGSSNGSAISVSTNNANDFIFGGFRDGGQIGPAAGFTQIAPSSGFTLAQYKIVTTTQSGLSVSDPAGANGGVTDAFVCGP